MQWMSDAFQRGAAGFDLPGWMMLFFMYAFLGWCAEVAFAACCEGRFVNRGFLNGPICPIYGFGVVGVALLLEPVSDDLLLLFLGSMLVTTAIEFLTGFVLEKIFHAKWWDYTDRKLNIMGYVCLEFSLMWGVACMVVVRLIHPLLCGLVRLMPYVLTVALDCVFSAIMAADIAATLVAIRNLNARLSRLTELAAEIHGVSDGIGLAISDKTIEARKRAVQQGERLREEMRTINEKKAETEKRIGKKIELFNERMDQTIERFTKPERTQKRRTKELKKKFSTLASSKPVLQTRLLNAFPGMKSQRHQDALDALRKHLKRK